MAVTKPRFAQGKREKWARERELDIRGSLWGVDLHKPRRVGGQKAMNQREVGNCLCTQHAITLTYVTIIQNSSCMFSKWYSFNRRNHAKLM